MKLSIVIVSYNTKNLLEDCLGSIYQDLPENYEIIVVDNASEDGSPEMVKKRFPQVKLHKNKQNTGYAQANNQAIKQAQGEYVLLLNSDTLASIKSFKTLVNFLDTHPEVGIVTPKLLNQDKSIQQNGGALPNLFNIFAWQFFLDEVPLLTHLFQPYQQDDLEYYLTTRKTGWVSGAAMMIRKSLLNQIGLLDEKIFMYAEDIDLCLRATHTHAQVWIEAKAEIIHLGHGSGSSQKAILGEYKGLKYLFGKHYPKQADVINTILYYGASFRAIIYKLLKNEPKSKIYQQAAQVVR